MKKGDDGYWEWRKKVGRPKNIKTPQELWDLACEYFQTVDENPILLQEQKRGSVNMPRSAEGIDPKLMEQIINPVISLETQRPYTWTGLESYLFEQRHVILDLEDYRYNRDGRYSEYGGIIRAIDRIIFTQKFEGAAAGIFNANIIARDLGLVDKSEQKNKVEVTEKIVGVRLVKDE